MPDTMNTPPASEPYEAPYAGNEDMWESRPRPPGVEPEAERKAREAKYAKSPS